MSKLNKTFLLFLNLQKQSVFRGLCTFFHHSPVTPTSHFRFKYTHFSFNKNPFFYFLFLQNFVSAKMRFSSVNLQNLCGTIVEG